jgi:hypothetical protein
MAYTNPYSQQLSLNIPPGRDANELVSVPGDNWVLPDTSAGSSTLEANPGYDQVRKAFHHGEEAYLMSRPPWQTSPSFKVVRGPTASKSISPSKTSSRTTKIKVVLSAVGKDLSAYIAANTSDASKSYNDT